jgi:hypothetical protein
VVEIAAVVALDGQPMLLERALDRGGSATRPAASGDRVDEQGDWSGHG